MFPQPYSKPLWKTRVTWSDPVMTRQVDNDDLNAGARGQYDWRQTQTN